MAGGFLGHIRTLPSTMSASSVKDGIVGAGRGNLSIPILLLALLGMMTLPLPPFLLDAFFSFNIALSIVVLLVAVYTLRPLDFAVFPTILLISTLMRLALNVASTRVVLLEGHKGGDAAGKVIQSFGEVVIGGNYAVGLVVFIILIIINFVVVTKGAGRISEVSARFTLDAMPGKQMAIDADLNAGLIDQEEARTRRTDVASEADFYGAMDGASKFVRGDSVAGILILVINIIGGLIVGMAQHDLDFQVALEFYVLLTIGDGLVAQIPSLLLSTAAAIMVTRVNSSEDMNRQVLSQMFESPKALSVAACILFIMGAIPGMPHVPFIGLAAICGTIAYYIHFKQSEAEVVDEGGFVHSRVSTEPNARLQANPSAAPSLPAPSTVENGGQEEPVEVSWDDVQPVDIIGLEVGYRLISLVDKAQGGELLGRIKGVRKKLSQDLGFLVPSVHIRDNLDLMPNSYQLSLMGVTIGEGEVFPGRFMAINPGQVFGKLEGKATQDPAFGLEAYWIDDDKQDQAQSLGYTVVDPATVIATHLNQVMSSHAHELIGHEDVQKWLDLLAEKSPKLVEALIPNTVTINQLLKVLQTLLMEKVSIKDMRSIAEALAARGSNAMSTSALTAVVRAALSRQIVQSIVGQDPNLPVITLDSRLEHLLLQTMEQAQKAGADDGAFIEPQLAEKLNRGVVDAARKLEALGKPLVLLVAAPIRTMMLKFVRFHVPDMQVLAYNEIPDSKQITIELTVGGDFVEN